MLNLVQHLVFFKDPETIRSGGQGDTFIIINNFTISPLHYLTISPINTGTKHQTSTAGARGTLPDYTDMVITALGDQDTMGHSIRSV
jgi:hypothetical protein